MRQPWPILLIHGNPGSARGFDAFRERLTKEGLITHAFTLPGFDGQPPPAGGRYDLASQARHLWARLDEAGVRDVVLFGHSHGGSVGVVMAGQRPQRVKGLCLCASAGLAVGNYWLLGNPLARAASPLLGKVVDELELETFLARSLTRQAIAPGRPLPPNDQLVPLTGDSLRAAIATAAQWDGAVVAHHARAIRCPVLVLHGELDRNVPPWQIQGLLRVLPGARAIWLPAVAHRPHHEAPGTVVEALSSLCRQ